MESLGIRVLQFRNLDVTQNFAGVCQAIQMAVNARLPHPFPSRGAFSRIAHFKSEP